MALRGGIRSGNDYKLLVNFGTGTLDLFLNGLLMASDVAFNNPNPVFRGGIFFLDRVAGTDSAFFDNFAVAVVPERATLALIGVAIAGFGFAGVPILFPRPHDNADPLVVSDICANEIEYPERCANDCAERDNPVRAHARFRIGVTSGAASASR